MAAFDERTAKDMQKLVNIWIAKSARADRIQNRLMPMFLYLMNPTTGSKLKAGVIVSQVLCPARQNRAKGFSNDICEWLLWCSANVAREPGREFGFSMKF
jgi:hypothetical protein